MPRIPSSFEPRDWESHLTFSEANGIAEARWAPIGASICYPVLGEHDVAPEQEAVAANTPQLKFHGGCGYSLGAFSEFFVEAGREPNPVTFKMGGIEGSFGDLTPLAHFLFHYGHDDDLQGELDWWDTIRLFGCTADMAEAAIISAILYLGREHNLHCELVSLGDAEWPDEEEHTGEVKEYAFPNGFADVEPLRMLLRGRQESDPDHAFLQLYRVLEFFSVLTIEADVDRMRRDGGLSTRKFLLDVNTLVGRDERTTLGKLLARIADRAILDGAHAAGLIDAATPNSLLQALYAFRNSVVHAKADQQAALFSEPIFTHESKATAWKRVCEKLAWNAMNIFGSRLP